MKVKSKAELREENRRLRAELLGQLGTRVTDLELKMHRLRNELNKVEAELEAVRQYRDAMRAYAKQAG